MKKRIKKMARKLLPTFYTKLAMKKRDMIMDKFIKDYPNTVIFEAINKNERKLYSQDNQDYIIHKNFFKDKKDGFFCDIGGNHPININNTLYFEQLGWTGIAFEPLPHMSELWQKNRKAKLFPFALSDTNKNVTFTVVKDTTGWEDMLSFIKETRDVKYDYKTEEIEIETKVFKDIMGRENITYIDYLSLDVEGHELNILQGIDFEKVQINVLTVENNPPENQWYGDENIRTLLINNNFVLWGRIVGLDDIYVHKDYLKNCTIQTDNKAKVC